MKRAVDEFLWDFQAGEVLIVKRRKITELDSTLDKDILNKLPGFSSVSNQSSIAPVKKTLMAPPENTQLNPIIARLVKEQQMKKAGLQNHGTNVGLTKSTPFTLNATEPAKPQMQMTSQKSTPFSFQPELLKPSQAQPTATSMSEPVYRLGQKICLKDGRVGTIRFIGKTDFAQGDWIGVCLDAATSGATDGTIGGVRYFACSPSHGIFVKPSKIRTPDTVGILKQEQQPKGHIVDGEFKLLVPKQTPENPEWDAMTLENNILKLRNQLKTRANAVCHAYFNDKECERGSECSFSHCPNLRKKRIDIIGKLKDLQARQWKIKQKK